MILNVHGNPPLLSKMRNHLVLYPRYRVKAEAEVFNANRCGRAGRLLSERFMMGAQYAFGIVSRLRVIRRLEDGFAE